MRKIIPILLSTILMMGCASLDCPLNNTVYTKYKLAGNITTLSDTLTISTLRMDGADSVLINQDVMVDSFSIPISYSQPEDILFFEMRDTLGVTYRDTIKVRKENEAHFESVDCSPAFFHTITGVETTHNKIDSIVINNKAVNYDATKAHFLIYFGTRY